MAISTQTQNLNLIPGKSAPVVVHCSQGNIGDTVQFYLYNGDEPFYPTNVSIAVHGVRADGSVFGPYAVSITSGSNLVSFELVTAMTSINGAAIGELVITDNDENQIGSANFGILVEATPYSSTVTYEDDLSIYQRILAYVQSFPASVTDQITSEANARSAAISSVRADLNAESSARTSDYNDLKSKIDGESSARASSDERLQSQIDQLVAPTGSAPSEAEVINARIDSDAVTYSTLGESIRTQASDIQKGLNNVFLYIPSWSKGYYDASDGNKKGTASNVSATFDSLLSYKKGSYIRITSGYTIDIVRYVGTTASLYKYHAVGTYYFTEDIVCRLNVSKSDSSTLDYSTMNDYIKIYRNNGTYTSESSARFGDYIVSGRTMNRDIVWQYGFYNGSNGALGGATDNKSVCMINSFTASPGDYIVAPANMNYFIHRYENGVWQELLVQRYGSSGFSTYVFETNMECKLAVSKSDSSAIADIDDFISGIIICRKKYNENPWSGKRIVWFGTSIPAGVVNGYSYPSLIGDMLRAIVYNESVGESSVRSGNYNAVSENDPNGYGGVFYNVLLRSLGLSSTDKQAIFDNWNKWKNIIPNAPASIDSEQQTFFKNCSYDVKLDKYLQGGSVGNVDVYVFDHGYNDAGNDYDYDSLKTIPSNANDTKYFIGAMNTLITHIIGENPKAIIVVAGHYENTIHPAIAEAQTIVANSWSLPLIKTWESTGWGIKAVNTRWYWDSSTGKLAYGNTYNTISTKDLALRDGIHPHTDLSGSAIRKLASIEGSWFRAHSVGL